ncbi:MAG: S1C family serine protease [Candidatus Coproplasma sp.]
MKKKFLACAALAATLSVTAFCGCSQPKGIVSIEKTDSVGLIDYYTISYSDGTTSTFTVTNGKDGKDGQDAPALTVDDVYEFYRETNPDMSKEEFVEQFLSIDGGESQSNLNAVSAMLCSGLKIYTFFNVNNVWNGGTYETYSLGSGVIYRIDEDYSYILTNYHVVYEDSDVSDDKITDKIYAYMYGSEYKPVRNSSTGKYTATDNYALTCEFVGGSPECDVAIVKVDTATLTAKYPYAKAVKVNESYQVGQQVYAFGDPGGYGLSVTKGIVSVELETVSLDVAGTRDFYVLRTDADMTHGNSGGGLFNAYGEFVALCNAGSESIESLNYAVPAKAVAPCADGVIYYNKQNESYHGTYRMYLNVNLVESNCRYVYDEKTKTGKVKCDVSVYKSETDEANPAEGTPAYLMGLQGGDSIKAISINGTAYEINRLFDISNTLMRVREGDSVSVILQRDGEEITSAAYVATQADFKAI